MKYNNNNIFARVLRGEIPNQTVYEDEFVLAFKDINPKAQHHVLVIPKGEYVSFDDFHQKASADEMCGFFKAVGLIAHNLGLQEKGYRLIANHGEHGRQEVPHFHLHILGGEDTGPMTCKD